LDIKLSSSDDDGQRFQGIDAKLKEYGQMLNQTFTRGSKFEDFILEFVNNEINTASSLAQMVQHDVTISRNFLRERKGYNSHIN